MKYPVFALFALCVFLMAACQGGGGADTSNATPTITDPNQLNEEIMIEIIAAKAMTNKYDSTFQKTMLFVRKMKQSVSGLGEEKKKQVMKVHEGIRVFTDPYEILLNGTVQLEALSVKLSAGSANVVDVQKEFEPLKKDMELATKQLAAAQVDFAALEAKFERIFTEANQQAAEKGQ